MYYFEVSSKANSSLQKGFILFNKDIYPDFSLSDFSQVPGVYELGFRATRGRRGKLEPKLVSIDFNSLDMPTPIEFINQYFIENIQDDFVVYLSALAAVTIIKKLINF